MKTCRASVRDESAVANLVSVLIFGVVVVAIIALAMTFGPKRESEPIAEKSGPGLVGDGPTDVVEPGTVHVHFLVGTLQNSSTLVRYEIASTVTGFVRPPLTLASNQSFDPAGMSRTNWTTGGIEKLIVGGNPVELVAPSPCRPGSWYFDVVWGQLYKIHKLANGVEVTNKLSLSKLHVHQVSSKDVKPGRDSALEIYIDETDDAVEIRDDWKS